jgi:putative ABC transport system permease protein
VKAALWLARNELRHMRARVVVSVAVVAAPIALCVAVELVSSARENAAAAEIDHIGAPLRLVPSGVTAGQIARYSSSGRTMPVSQAETLQSGLHRWVRAVDARLVLTEAIDGSPAPVVGVDPRFLVSRLEPLRRLRTATVAVGFALAEARGYRRGSPVRVAGQDAVVADVLAQTATTSDGAVFVPLARAQAMLRAPGAINVVDLYLRPGAPVDEIESYLREKHPEVGLIRTPRGEVADGETGEVLRFNRWALYAISAAAVVVCLIVGAYLNVADRRHEVATLVAIGSSAGTVLAALVARAAVIGTLGSLVGYGGGSLAALIQSHLSVGDVPWSWGLPVTVVGISLALSVLTTAPVTAVAVFQDHVALLQES